MKSILRSIYCGMAIGVPACRISTLKIMILFLEAPQLFIGSLIYESNLIVQDIGGIWNYLEPYYGRRSCDQLCRSSKFVFILRKFMSAIQDRTVMGGFSFEKCSAA